MKCRGLGRAIASNCHMQMVVRSEPFILYALKIVNSKAIGMHKIKHASFILHPDQPFSPTCLITRGSLVLSLHLFSCNCEPFMALLKGVP